ncbi:MAG: hypothetical protein E7418_03845 [Ruminococcaceae bacterium]|nr:hypothetical protein [Oscillospiraceae bacterium]
MGDFSVILALCDECIKHNKTLDFCIDREFVCDICGRRSYKTFSAIVDDEDDVADILKDFYKNDEIFNRAIQNRSCKLLYGKSAEIE